MYVKLRMLLLLILGQIFADYMAHLCRYYGKYLCFFLHSGHSPLMTKETEWG